MSTTFATVRERKCGCGEGCPEVYVDFADCNGGSITLKQDGEWIDLTPTMIAELVDALLEYQLKRI